MLSRAYPTGIPVEDYYAVIEVLLERLSFHNISAVLGLLFPGREGFYNDVLGVAGKDIVIPPATRERVEATLSQYGLEHWRTQDD
jgi:hypothetical protein